MTIINPDHEAAIAAFHRAAARAGTGGDGRYARAVAFLEPSVRRELEAAAPRPPAEAQRCTCPSGDGSLRWPCPAHPAEAQAQGGGEVIGWLRHRPDGTPDWSEDCLGTDTHFLDPELKSDGFTLRPLVYGDTAPPSAPVGVEGLVAKWRSEAERDGVGDLIDRGHSNGLHAAADELEKALAQHPSAAPVGVEGLAESLRREAYHRRKGHNNGLRNKETARLMDAAANALAQQPATVECDCPSGRADHASWCAVSKAQDTALAAQPGGDHG